MNGLIIFIIIILIIAIAFYGTYFGLVMYKDLILQKLAAVDARLKARQEAITTFIDSAENVMVNDEVIIFAVRKVIIDINKLPARWNNNKERFTMENDLDIKLNTLFNAAIKYDGIKNNPHLTRNLQAFINIQAMLKPSVDDYNKTLRAYKSLINSPIGQILAPKLNISCHFVEYYIPEN